jgi:hypothetical protein
MHTMKNPFSLRKIVTILVIALLGMVLAFFVIPIVSYWRNANADAGAAVNPVKPVSSTKSARNAADSAYGQRGDATARSRESEKFGVSAVPQITYLPGVRRSLKMYEGPVDANRLVLTSTPGWWLYAYSVEEAAWLDKHGYPTPAEDQRLRASSPQELKRLMDRGDRNARALLAAETARNIFNGTPEKNAGIGVSMGIGDLEIGNPYQAIVIAENYMALRNSYYAKPPDQREEQQLRALASMAQTAEYAWQIARVQGDTATDAISTRSKWDAFALIGDQPQPQLSAEAFISTIYSMQQRRPAAGLPPLDFESRPSPLLLTHRAKPTQVLERY